MEAAPSGYQPIIRARSSALSRNRSYNSAAIQRCQLALRRMKSAPCSAIITVGALVLPDVIRGMTDASMTRKPGDAADAQAVVDDGERVDAHAARADRVEDRRAEIAGRAPQIGVARERRPRQPFLGREPRERAAPP